MSSIDENFIVKTGLTVGSTTITAATGAIVTSGNITVGNTSINGTTGAITVGGTTINGTTGAITTSSTITVGNTAIASTGPLTSSNVQITGGSISNTTVTGSTGSFTTLTASSMNNTVIGNVTPAAGTFTTLTTTNLSGATVTGNLILNADPTAALGAATKQYVDAVANGLNIHLAVEIATTAASNLPAHVYVLGATGADGGTGVSAFLEGSSVGALGIVSGYNNLAVNDRVLVKDEAIPMQNGIYVINSLGGVASKWKMTRASDSDNHALATDVGPGDMVYVVDGALKGTQWAITNEGAIIIGTTGIEYTQISGPGSFVGGTGISVTSNTITNTGVTTLATAGVGLAVNQASGTVTVSSNATSTNTASTIVARDASGNFAAGTITALCTSAKYADLAEVYAADAEYAPGTVLEFGGAAEVTLASEGTRRVAGVVSTNPAYLMNNECDAILSAPIALQGRVPCRVVGKVAKGDMLVSAGNGAARAEADPKLGQVIGKALENFDGVDGVIEVVVGRL